MSVFRLPIPGGPSRPTSDFSCTNRFPSDFLSDFRVPRAVRAWVGLELPFRFGCLPVVEGRGEFFAGRPGAFAPARSPPAAT